MTKDNGSLLADFIEQRLDLLTNHLLAYPKISGSAEMRPLINSWLVNQIACYRGKPFRAGEWTAQTADFFQRSGGGLEEAFRLFRQCRNGLIAYCLNKVEGLADSGVYALVMEGADIHDTHLIEYCAQQAREQEAADRRRCGMIAEVVNHPLVLLNDRGFIEMVNRPFARHLSVAPEALAGRDMLALCDEVTSGRLRNALRHKSPGKQLKSFLGTLQEGDASITARFHVQQLFDAAGRRSGAAVCLETDAAHANEGMTDGDDDNIRYVEDRLLGVIPFPVQVLAEDGTITFGSDTLQTVAPEEYDSTEPLCCFLYRNRYGNTRPCPCHATFETGQFHMEELSYPGPTDTRWYMLLILPAPEACGRIVRAICCIYDMTRRKQIQKQLETEIITQQRSSLMSQVAVTVAHQLRNPLSVVLGFAEMMHKGLPPEQTFEAVTRILRNAVRCKDIVENLLDFGKGMPLERRTLDFSMLVRESVRPMLTPAQNRIIEWRLTETPVPVECIPEQLTQVVLSLLDNALRVARSRVVCSLEVKGDAARLRVVDDGPGIPAEIRDQIFEPFFTTRREAGAVGLGLSLARAVANDYGGSLTVSSSTGSEPDGACMVLQLPLLRPTKKQADAADVSEAGEPRSATAHSVLIVDDEVDLLDLMKTALYMRGYLVDTVSSGMEAMDKLENNRYDAAVIDFLLAGAMSGADVYNYIRERRPELKDHTFFITADTMNYQTRLFLEGAGCPVLEKPFLMADFISELQKVTAKP